MSVFTLDAPSTRATELQDLQSLAEGLWNQILAGNDSPRLRERVMRLEAAQAALIWEAPAMLAACGGCGSVPAA